MSDRSTRVNLENDQEQKINPATEEKQDNIITAIDNISDLQISTDLYGGGDLSVGVTEVEITITGTPEYITMQADESNTGIIYIGKTGVLSDGSNHLKRLWAGDDLSMSYDDTTNALYAISDTAGQSLDRGALL